MPLEPEILDRNAVVKLRLSLFISQAYRQELSLISRVVDAAFYNAQGTGVSPFLILAIIAKESSFYPAASSGYGALGLMQVVPRMHPKAVAAIQHPAGLLHPESNVATGTLILCRYLVSSKGSLYKALYRYSGGARSYYAKVSKYKDDFSRIGAST
jgi:soluble lytic murein transglycosylase-like protein